VLSRGRRKVTVRLSGGLQVHFRFFEAESFRAALMYFGGSKAHNIALRRVAQDRGWKLNEYRLSKGQRRLAGKDEPGVYRRLRLPWIPPELREDRGEIEAAAEEDLMPLAVNVARRGWREAKDVLNTVTAETLRKRISRT